MREFAAGETRTSGYPDNRHREISGPDVRKAAFLFKVLSHPDRLRLACRLGDGGPTTQRELIAEFGWPQSTAARHIAALREAGLIAAERDGSEIRLRIGAEIGLQLMTTVCDWLHRSAGSPARDWTGAPSLRLPVSAGLMPAAGVGRGETT